MIFSNSSIETAGNITCLKALSYLKKCLYFDFLVGDNNDLILGMLLFNVFYILMGHLLFKTEKNPGFNLVLFEIKLVFDHRFGKSKHYIHSF